jgi:hypothetical protein
MRCIVPAFSRTAGMVTENPHRSGKWPPFWPLIGIVLIGAFLRIFQLGGQLIIDDEWHALNAVQDHDFAWIFSHLGHADHSIPLALYYEFLSQTTGLSELSMRLPLVLAGILTILLLPRLFTRWLKPRECLLMAALLAISPFLVNYSRIARPYAILALLVGACIPLAWSWWHHRKPVHGIVWACCAIFAAWLNPVTLAISTAPFLWFGISAFRSHASSQSLVRLTVMGVAIAAGVALLLYVPLSNDWASLAVKSGVHRVSLQTVFVTLGLFTGSGITFVALIMLALVVTGWWELRQRDRDFAFYVLMIMGASSIAVSLTGAEWIGQGIVLGRYLLGLLPVFLALAAIGLVAVGDKLLAFVRQTDSSPFLVAAVLLLFLSGPLPGSGTVPNQFMHHMNEQFDYNDERNPIRAALEPIVVESFYEEIARLHPDGDALIVETPWYLESNWNALPIYQQTHGQRVAVAFAGGTCAGRLYGELRNDIEGLEFRHFVPLRSVLEGNTGATYLIFRTAPLPGAREIQLDRQKCERSIKDALGEPWRTQNGAMVFRING